MVAQLKATTRAASVLSGALLLAGFSAAPPSTLPASASRSWIAGNAQEALDGLEAAPASPERDLNRAVVRLYLGEALGAETALDDLRQRLPNWTPALRWLGRAQQALGRAKAWESAAALLSRKDADEVDSLWAGRLFLDSGDLPRARWAFQKAVGDDAGLELGWVGLAEAEERLGNAPAAREAAARAFALRGGEPVGAKTPALAVATTNPGVAPRLYPRERLAYRVKYLFLRLASLTLETEEGIRYGGRPASRVVLRMKSNPKVPFFHIDSRFESIVGEDGAVLAHRHTASDSDAGDDEAAYDMNRESGRCTVRVVRDGLLGYEILPLPPNAQDGVSVLLVARALAKERGSVVVPTAVDAMWWTTRLWTLGPEAIRWSDREVRTVHARSVGQYRGPGGLSGVVDLWVSDDERALPYRARMKVAVGSVELELLPDDPKAEPSLTGDSAS